MAFIIQLRIFVLCALCVTMFTLYHKKVTSPVAPCFRKIWSMALKQGKKIARAVQCGIFRYQVLWLLIIRGELLYAFLGGFTKQVRKATVSPVMSVSPYICPYSTARF